MLLACEGLYGSKRHVSCFLQTSIEIKVDLVVLSSSGHADDLVAIQALME